LKRFFNKKLLLCAFFVTVLYFIFEFILYIFDSALLSYSLLFIGLIFYKRIQKGFVIFTEKILNYIDSKGIRSSIHKINLSNLLILSLIIFYLIQPLFNIKLGYNYIGIKGKTSINEPRFFGAFEGRGLLFKKYDKMGIEDFENIQLEKFDKVSSEKFYFKDAAVFLGYKYKNDGFSFSGIFWLIMENLIYSFSHIFILSLFIIYYLQKYLDDIEFYELEN